MSCLSLATRAGPTPFSQRRKPASYWPSSAAPVRSSWTEVVSGVPVSSHTCRAPMRKSCPAAAELKPRLSVCASSMIIRWMGRREAGDPLSAPCPLVAAHSSTSAPAMASTRALPEPWTLATLSCGANCLSSSIHWPRSETGARMSVTPHVPGASFLTAGPSSSDSSTGLRHSAAVGLSPPASGFARISEIDTIVLPIPTSDVSQPPRTRKLSVRPAMVPAIDGLRTPSRFGSLDRSTPSMKARHCFW